MRRELTSPPDLPHLYSIPSQQILEGPEKLSYLKVKVKTPQSEKILEMKRDHFDGLKNIPWPVPFEDATIGDDLRSTPFIQSENLTIEKTAREIVGDEPSALQASLALMNWVHQNVKPVPTVSIPSATQVLAVRKGDCNEYTALFTALARSLGIPTKMVAGLVYQNGRFFYHAWPEVYLGRWVGFDPTFGQAPIDVSHIPLVKGNLKEQINLLSTLGQTKVFILETKENNK